MNVPPLTLRLVKGWPLTAAEGDANWTTLRDFCNALAALQAVALNPDGTLKAGAVWATNVLVDRIITRDKLWWVPMFYGTATGTNNYALTIAPNGTFTPGDGATTSFIVWVKFTNANTATPCDIAINGTAAKAIKKNINQDLATGDIGAGQVYCLAYDGTNYQIVSQITPPINTLLPYALLEDRQAPGTPGGQPVATNWTHASNQRAIQEQIDASNIVSCPTATTFRLNPGTYLIKISAPAWSVDNHMIRLHNVTDAVAQAYGSSEYSRNDPAVAASTTRSHLCHRWTIPAGGPKDYSVQHYVAAVPVGPPTHGFGRPLNAVVQEVYTQVEILKEG